MICNGVFCATTQAAVAGFLPVLIFSEIGPDLLVRKGGLEPPRFYPPKSQVQRERKINSLAQFGCFRIR